MTIRPAPQRGQTRIGVTVASWTGGVIGSGAVGAMSPYKTFLATWKPAGGVIRVVLVDEPTRWRA